MGETIERELASIGSMITSTAHVSPDMRVKAVAERFFQESGLDAIALVEEGRPVGLVSRNKLLFTLFRRFGFELYEKKPISIIAEKEPLTALKSEDISSALDLAMSRPFNDVYDDIVVVDEDGFYAGLLSVKKMVLEQGNSLANSIMHKELANAKALELEKVSQIKTEFIANVTHELRAPVNAIIGLAELMKISCDKGYIDQLKDRLSLLSSSATSLRAIITNILDLSKIEAGKMEAILEEFELLPLLNEIAETARVLVGEKPVAVEVLISEPDLLLVTDRIKLRQIMLNLLSNAVKFTDRGSILVEAGLEEDNVWIRVSDTGMGIREEDQARLFSAFTQIENTHTKRHEGTGLGLTITRGLLELVGGSVDLKSRFGSGTTFTIKIPREVVRDGEKENSCCG